MKRKCVICGALCNEFDMMTINTGRLQWLCWSCYKNGQYEAGKNEMRRADALRKQLGQKRSIHNGETRFRHRD